MDDGQHRAFSVANAPGDDHLQLHVRHYPGGAFSDVAVEQLQSGAPVKIRGPYGHFYLRPRSGDSAIFIAGGTGFAPIKAIIEQALAQGLEKPTHLYWGARSADELYLHGLAQDWAQKHGQFHYVPVVSEPDSAWEGRVGLVHQAAIDDFDALSGSAVYASGPPAMVQTIEETFRKRGLSPDHLYSDMYPSGRASSEDP